MSKKIFDMSKMTKKGQARFEQIREKSMYLFNEKGYVNTSMDKIAKACKCDVANLYNYFQNKEHILYHVIKSMITDRVEESSKIVRLDNLSTIEKIKVIICKQMDSRVKLGFTDLYTKFKGDLAPAHASKIVSMRDKYDQVLRSLIIKGIEDGEFKPVDVKITVITIESFIERIIVWYSPKGKLTLEEITDNFYDLLFHGICLKTSKGTPKMSAINRKINNSKDKKCTDILFAG